MSPAAPPDAIQANSHAGTSHKKKGKRKRPRRPNDSKAGDGEELATDQQSSTSTRDDTKPLDQFAVVEEPEQDSSVSMTDSKDIEQSELIPSSPYSEPPQANGHIRELSHSANGNSASSEHIASTNRDTHTHDASAKLEAMSQEREALRAEVERLRKQLENIQGLKSTEVIKLKTDLEESEAAKAEAEQQYQTLMERVEKIKSTLGERLKRDRAELDEANLRIEELESQNEELQKGGSTYEDDIARMKDELLKANRELTGLRSRNTLSQQNWLMEKDEMARQLQHFRSELESASGVMHEWEVIAMEERQVRKSLGEKVADLEEQLATLREAHNTAAEERDSSLQTIDGLQRALQEIQDARRKELRDLVESSEEQLQGMKKKVEDADKRVAEAEATKESLAKELERTAPFEKEVREKNLLIGKLRHEGIILNDHLTKALRYLKKTKPDEQVDRQIISNYLLQFLSIDRSDPKRFQILQVIAGYLAWTEEQKERAGLARPGASHSSLRLPASPFHRTPSTPSLSNEFFSETSSATGKESLADLWAGFLARSADEGRSAETMGAASRTGIVESSIGTGNILTRPDGKG